MADIPSETHSQPVTYVVLDTLLTTCGSPCGAVSGGRKWGPDEGVGGGKTVSPCVCSCSS